MSQSNQSDLLLVFIAAAIAICGCDQSTSKGVPRTGIASVMTASDLKLDETKVENAPRYIHADHFAIIRVDVNRILKQASLQELDWEQLFQPLIQPLGGLFGSVSEIKELTLLLDQEFFSLVPNGFNEEDKRTQPWVLVLTGHQPLSRSRLPDRFAEIENTDKSVYLDDEQHQQLWYIDTLSIALGSPEAISKIINNNPGNSSLINSVGMQSNAAIVGNARISPIRSTIKSVLTPMQGMSPEIGTLVRVVDSLNRFDFAMDLAANQLGQATFEFSDSSMAVIFRDQMSDSIKMMSSTVGQLSQIDSRFDEITLATPTQTRLWPIVINEITENGLTITLDGNRVSLSINRPPSFDNLLAALVDDANAQTRIEERRKRIKSVADALLAYHDSYGYFPSASWKGEEQNQSFSWRVAVLPLLGHHDLYDQFNFQEPWDSEHNLEVAMSIPDEFAWPIEVIGGPDGPFDNDRSITLSDITDEHDSTVMVVDMAHGESELWHKPSLISFSKQGELPRLGSPHENGVLVATFDGAVRVLSRKSETSFRAALTHQARDRVGRQGFQQ